MSERFYKNTKFSQVDLSKTFIPIDNENFRQSGIISLENINNCLNLKLNDNITSIPYTNQNENPTLVPSKNIIKTYVSIDENYLYVWIDSLQKWKRILLTEWE